MKKLIIVTAVLAMIGLSSQAAGPAVQMKTSGPSGQGNVIWYAPSTGITNMEMTPGGLSNVVFAESPEIPSLTVGELAVQTNATVGGTISASGKAFFGAVISNASLTASKPVFTDASKQLVSGTTGSAVTNATVGGGVLSGVSTVITNGSLSSGNQVDPSVTNIALQTQVDPSVTNIALQTQVDPSVTNIALQTQVDPSVTNGSLTIYYQVDKSVTGIVVQTGLMYDSVGGTCTNAAGNIQIPTNFVLQYEGDLGVTNVSLTMLMASVPALTNVVAQMASVPALTNVVAQMASVPALTNVVAQMASVPALTNSTLTLQTGTPAVSTPTITLTHGTVAKP